MFALSETLELDFVKETTSTGIEKRGQQVFVIKDSPSSVVCMVGSKAKSVPFKILCVLYS